MACHCGVAMYSSPPQGVPLCIVALHGGFENQVRICGSRKDAERNSANVCYTELKENEV